MSNRYLNSAFENGTSKNKRTNVEKNKNENNKMTINICYYFTRSKQRTQRETNEEVRNNSKKEN